MGNLAEVRKSTIDIVEQKIKAFQETGELHFPPNYSPQNALKSAWLILQGTKDKSGKPVLEVCAKESIANALLNTVIQGLSPAKKQIYYIAYGTTLDATRSYFGTAAVTKRLDGVEDVFAQVIYKGDEFEFAIEKGTKRIIKHIQSLENMEEIIGAYCTIIHHDGKEYTEIMTKKQIDISWTKTKNGGGVQREFPEEMAKRTVINRTCKMFVNTSDDSDLIINAFHETSGYEDKEKAVEIEVQSSANKEVIDIIPVEDNEEPKLPEADF